MHGLLVYVACVACQQCVTRALARELASALCMRMISSSRARRGVAASASEFLKT